ncbi:unnamed protein product [Meloidogyne enterolobii]|uniref:Uncharacterized protein n=1 Tax=Meloidogyne enterolobii TaxID=390850 RepID=A0ACB1AIN6_MELEN
MVSTHENFPTQKFFLFSDGMNVTVINDRSENYIRNQLVIFDRKWVSQLRFFFGTEFDRLFIHQNSVGKMLDEELVLISIKDMELALMGRLKKISNFVEEKESEEKNEVKNEGEKSFLNLIYEIAVLGVLYENYDKPIVVVGVRENQHNSNELIPDEIISAFRAKGLNKTKIGSKKVGIHFDLLFCAGGANDKIRDKILGSFCLILEILKIRGQGTGMGPLLRLCLGGAPNAMKNEAPDRHRYSDMEVIARSFRSPRKGALPTELPGRCFHPLF